MNRLAVILSAAALVWCGVLTYQQTAGPGADMPDALKSGQRALVAYVHGDSLQQGYRYISVLEDQVMNVAERLQLQLDSVVQPLRDEAQELIAYAQTAEATQEEVQMASERLSEIEEQVNQLNAREQRAMSNLERQLQGQISARLASELEAFAAETGIDVIVNWGLSGEGVLYGAPEYDVTQALLAFLNERVEKPQIEGVNAETEGAK